MLAEKPAVLALSDLKERKDSLLALAVVVLTFPKPTAEVEL